MARIVYRIRGADLDVRPDLGCLRQTDGAEVYLRPKAFQTLLLLLENRHRVVAKEEIARTIWRDTAVTDDAVVQCIVEIRKTLGDAPRDARYIRTLSKTGYRFVGEVDVEEAAEPQTDDEPDVARPPVVDATVPHIDGVQSIAAPARSRRALVISLTVAALAAVIAGAAILRARRVDPGDKLLDALTSARAHRGAIAVMFLENQSQTPDLDWLREGIADMLVTGLSHSKAISVVGRQQLELLLARAGHAPDKPLDLAQAVDIARRGRLDYFVLGTFAKLGTTIRIDVRLHDAAGRLVSSEALTIDTPDDLLRQIDVLGWRLARRFGELEAAGSSSAGVLTSNLEAYRYYSLGVARANSFHNVEAIDLFTRATALDPQFAMAFARIGYAYGVTWNHVERARPYLAKAYGMSARLSEKDRLHVEAWNALVRFDYPSAIESFTKLIRVDPMEVEAYSRLGLLLAGERRYDESLDIFHRGLAVDPESGDLWNRLGGVYDELARTQDAIAARQKYVALQPNEPNAHDSLGLSYQNGGRYDDAVASYRRALELAPRFDIAWIHLGHAYVQMGRYDAAEDAYRRFISTGSSEQEVLRGYESLALLARRQHRYREAADLVRTRANVSRVFEGLIRLDAGESPERLAEEFRTPPQMPNRGSRWGDRGWLHFQAKLALKRGSPDKAIELLQSALRERPLLADVDSLEDCLANGYLELGRFDEAIAEYERVLKRNPKYPLAHYRLGQALEGKKQIDLARQSYRTFLEVWAGADPDVPEVVDARARLQAASNPE
jgi:tetratricopeptide (TPR) repeat protein/DNA-binding winged helix-turn-helix (wHTH) protein